MRPFMDKIKAMFSGGSAAESDHSHAGHDHSHDGHDHSHDAPATPMDPVGTSTPEATPPTSSEHDQSA